MTDRKSLVSTLWLTSSLVLLASVVGAPRSASGFVSVSSHNEFLLPNFSLPSAESTPWIRAAMATDAVVEVDALSSESEEEHRAEALDEPPVSFLIPRSFREVPDRQSIAPRSLISLYPLRC